MPSALEHCIPEEVLDKIVLLCSQRTLTNLSRCSKKINRIATPHLYSAITFKFTDGYVLRWILPFAHLIFTSPSHASFIRSFTIREKCFNATKPKEEANGDDIKVEGKRPWPNAGTPALEAVLKKLCARYTDDEDEADALSFVQNLYEKIKTGANEGPILALLLANLPNLQKLDLSCDIDPDKDMMNTLERVARHARSVNKVASAPTESHWIKRPNPSNTTPFSVPLDIHVTGLYATYQNHSFHLAACLNLPNLRSLYVNSMEEHGMLEENRGDLCFSLKPRSCPVEHIELRASKLHLKSLRYLIDATIPGKLKTFIYEAGNPIAFTYVNREAIVDSLQMHHDTLECLEIGHSFLCTIETNTEKHYTVSLRSFKSLKKLKISPGYIWGHMGITGEDDLKISALKEMLWELLPETLEELWITKVTGGACELEPGSKFIPALMMPALYLLVQNHDSYPKLSRLRIDGPAPQWKDNWLDQLTTFCHFAENSGICCTIIVPESLDYTERKWGWNQDVEWAKCFLEQHNRTKWIVVADEQDLGETLRAWKIRDEERRRGVERVASRLMLG